MPSLLPLRDYVLIRHDPEPEVPLDQIKKVGKDWGPIIATVVEVGDLVNARGMDESATVRDGKWALAVGDRVLVEGGRNGGIPVTTDEGEFVMLRDKMVLAVLR